MAGAPEVDEGSYRKAPTTTPRYEIVPSTDRVAVTKGKTATLKVYMTGYGKFERHKMLVFLDYDTLLSSEGGTISILSIDEEGAVLYGEEDGNFKHSIDGNSTTIFLSVYLFFDSPTFEFPPEDNASDRLYPTILAESLWGGHAPIEIELNISVS